MCGRLDRLTATSTGDSHRRRCWKWPLQWSMSWGCRWARTGRSCGDRTTNPARQPVRAGAMALKGLTIRVAKLGDRRTSRVPSALTKGGGLRGLDPASVGLTLNAVGSWVRPNSKSTTGSVKHARSGRGPCSDLRDPAGVHRGLRSRKRIRYYLLSRLDGWWVIVSPSPASPTGRPSGRPCQWP